jgi:hypothetical protein
MLSSLTAQLLQYYALIRSTIITGRNYVHSEQNLKNANHNPTDHFHNTDEFKYFHVYLTVKTEIPTHFRLCSLLCNTVFL